MILNYGQAAPSLEDDDAVHVLLDGHFRRTYCGRDVSACVNAVSLRFDPVPDAGVGCQSCLQWINPPDLAA